VTARSDNNLRIAITGTLVVHALLLLLLAWLFAGDAARKLWAEANKPPPEKEITLLFPDQIIPLLKPLPPPPPPKPEVYIRTSQNQAADTAPKNPAFIADRNTHAATVKAPSPNATEPMPTMDGLKIPTRELADRDYRDGELKDDARPKTPPKELTMLPPQPSTPPAPALPPVDKPDPTPPAPTTQKAAPAQTVAKAGPETSPFTKMMEEADKELSQVKKNRLSIEVKKPEKADSADKEETPLKAAKSPDAPPTPPKAEPTPPKPEMVQATPPETQPQKVIPKALPVLDDEPITRTTQNQDPNAFTPFTRTTQTKGTISNRGKVASVDAEETPKGRYIRQVTGQVERKWNIYRVLRRDGVTYGSLQIVFYVNKKGKVESLRVVNDKESNPVLTAFTLQAIRDADIPPMPADVIPSLPMNDQERLKIEYNVLIY
jgi:outer membrane biosynthesis protein TonB